MKKPVKPVIPRAAYARGQNPASIATRIRRGKPPSKPPPPPKPDPGPEPPEDPEWKEMGALRDMMWVATYDDRWDTTCPRQWLRKWQREKPMQFWKAFFKWHYAWERDMRRR